MKVVQELLAPAGSYEAFLAGIANGADAIYIGLSKFSARKMASNFTIDTAKEAINFAHLRNVKIYLTVNTLIYDYEMKEALECINELYKVGLDAVIVQDLGLAVNIKKLFPNLDIHASTQLTIHNIEQVRFLEKLGFSRIVLAREMTIPEIENICKNTNLEIEVFVHGALCVSYSGQCLMSSMIGNRSGNRGDCAGTCRQRYTLYGKNLKDNTFKIYKKDKYLLSKKDIYGLEHLKQLAKIGVKSFKIEGRGKTPEYVACITSKYRKYMDNMDENITTKDKTELLQIFNRGGLNTGYLDQVQFSSSITENTPKNSGIFLGTVLEQRKEYIKIKLDSSIGMQDGIEIYGEEIVSSLVTCIKNEQYKIENKTIAQGNVVWIGDVSKKVSVGSRVYKTSSKVLNLSLKECLINKEYNQKLGLNAVVTIKKNNNPKIYIKTQDLKNLECEYELEYICEEAKSSGVTKETIINNLAKTQDSPFKFLNIEINLDKNVFIPVSKLNELRRNALDKLANYYLVSKKIYEFDEKLTSTLDFSKYQILDKTSLIEKGLQKTSLYIYKYNDKKQYLNNNIKRIYINICDIIGKEMQVISKFKDNTEVYIYIPNIVIGNLKKYIDSNMENIIKLGVAGILIGNIGYIDLICDLKSKYEFDIIIDYTLNITNIYTAIIYLEKGIKNITPSVEIGKLELENIKKYCNLEFVSDYVTVMTSRYCVVGSFVSETKNNEKCSMPCRNGSYILKDNFKVDYHVICNNVDCQMRLVRKISSKDSLSEINNRDIRICDI